MKSPSILRSHSASALNLVFENMKSVVSTTTTTGCQTFNPVVLNVYWSWVENNTIEVTAVTPGTFKFRLSDTDALRKDLDDTLPRACKMAKQLKSPRLITFGFMREPGTDPEAILPYLREAAKIAEEHNLQLAIENEPGFYSDTGVHTAEIVKAIHLDHVGINWDPANAVVSGETEFPVGYEAVLPYLQNVHIKDAIPDPSRQMGKQTHRRWRRELARPAQSSPSGQTREPLDFGNARLPTHRIYQGRPPPPGHSLSTGPARRSCFSVMHLQDLLITGSLFFSGSIFAQDLGHWTDVTLEAGLEAYPSSRVKFTDLNSDGYPDVVLLPETNHRAAPTVYLHTGKSVRGGTALFTEKAGTGLPGVSRADVLVFADLDNDGHQDAILGRYLDIYQDNYEPPKTPPRQTAWLPGNGDGSFGNPVIIEAASPATTRAIAVGDVNFDGLPDLYLGNWYERYFTGYEAFSNDLLLQYLKDDGTRSFSRWSMPLENSTTSFETDLGGRPTYGVALPRLDDGIPMLLELNYGRRWNRLYQMERRTPLRIPPGSEAPAELKLQEPRALAQDVVRRLHGQNIAAGVHLDGDTIRHGVYPNWPRKNADGTLRSPRSDEPPFRANGNTFDAAIGDIDNDGDFDLFISTIIHAWAGNSSDRSRFLVNQLVETGKLDFQTPDHLKRRPHSRAPRGRGTTAGNTQNL